MTKKLALSRRDPARGVSEAAQSVRRRARQEAGCPAHARERIAEERIGISADSALRLSKALGTTPPFWLNLQNNYDLHVAERAVGKKLARIKPVVAELMS